MDGLLSRKISRALRALWLAAFFAGAAAAAPTDADHIIVPGGTPAAPTAAAAPAPAPLSNTFTLVAVLLLAGAGGWYLWRGRGGKFTGLDRATRQLAIDETRSLGNRQYLVVASYRDKKFLLGVCPGRIDLLAPLSDAATAPAQAKERP